MADIFELPLIPALTEKEGPAPNLIACERPVIVDPLAWSEDGSVAPTEGRVYAGSGRHFPELMGPRPWRTRVWQGVCRGRNGVEAKRNVRHLYSKADNVRRAWDASGVEVYDVVEWGWYRPPDRDGYSDRRWGVVVELSDDRLVLWEFRTIAKAVKASLRGKFAAQANEHALPVRMRAWEEERALGPEVDADEGDWEAIELLG